MRAVVDVGPCFEWLVDGAPGAPTPVHVLARLCPWLVEQGVPLARVEAFVRTLHPHIVGRRFEWVAPDSAVRVEEASWDYLLSEGFLRSPAAEVFRSGAAVRCALDGEGLRAWPALEALRAEGYTDFYAGPLTFLSGQSHAITFATRAPGGFSREHLEALAQVLRPLSRVAEILALSRTAVNLLNTYVGRNAGERILGGKIQRGESESLQAVLWFSDLRGFTTLSETVGTQEVLAVLNELFQCQVPAIERYGGEVLKFMGDGMLAIFPIPQGATEAQLRARCDAALEAAGDAFLALGAYNLRRALLPRPPVRLGLALHLGEVAYGNIGGAGRLDFTCIGPAVNMAARLEGVSSKLGHPLVVSAEVARHTTRSVRSVGFFELKGVAEPVEVFTPEG